MPYQPRNADPFSIPNPDPGRHYRWLADDPKRLGLWLRSYGDCPGYRLEVGEETCARLGFETQFMLDPMKRIRYGFNVLASIPIEEWERRQRERLDEQIEKFNAPLEKFAAAVDNIPGARARFDDAETFEDKKKFNTRESNNRVFVSSRSRKMDTGD